MEIINKHNKVAAGITVFVFMLVVIYLGLSIYFTKHLYFGSSINGTDVSGKTVEEIEKQMTSELQTYTLTVEEIGGKEERIKASDIDLKYKSYDQFNNFKEEQNPLIWVSSLFSTKNSKMTAQIIYDKDELKKHIDNLECLDSSNVVEPKSANFKYADNKYEIVNEVNGNKINEAVLVKQVTEAIENKKPTVNLESTNCYVKPLYTSKSQKTIETKDALNKYVATKITYTFGDDKEVLDGSTINNWLSVDNNLNITIDKAKEKDYILALAYKYNTIGITRSFHTTSGSTVNVEGGDYGWQINISKEVQNLSDAIKSGQTVSKEPAYTQKAAARTGSDIGNTYVEVDFSKQHLWFYKNGSLVVDGDVVTGNVSLNDSTPEGVYGIKDKERNATLKGQDYSTVVSYWMPFNQGIGLHDATWRNQFGGQIYLTNGSHGCVNCPYNLAETIFGSIDVGTPVVCHN